MGDGERFNVGFCVGVVEVGSNVSGESRVGVGFVVDVRTGVGD